VKALKLGEFSEERRTLSVWRWGSMFWTCEKEFPGTGRWKPVRRATADDLAQVDFDGAGIEATPAGEHESCGLKGSEVDDA